MSASTGSLLLFPHAAPRRRVRELPRGVASLVPAGEEERGPEVVSRLARMLNPVAPPDATILRDRMRGAARDLGRIDAAGLPVLVVGGLATPPELLQPLHDWLTILGCEPSIVTNLYGVDCGERSVARLERVLLETSATARRQVLLVGFSRGGQFARAVAVRHPERVAGLVTLGSPLNRMLGVSPRLRAQVVALGVAGSLGLPGSLRVSCLRGECCRQLREDLEAPFPEGIPFLSVFSRMDGRVDWRSSLDPGARHCEVRADHNGLLSSPATLHALAGEVRALARLRPVPAPRCGCGGVRERLAP